MNKIFLYSLIVIFSGCVAAGTLPHLAGSPATALVDGKGDFIELFDGKIIEGEISQLGNKNITIKGNRYHVKDIRSFQYKSEYKTTLKNAFITRIIKGKINLYRRSVSNTGNMMMDNKGGGTVTHFYLQKGDNGKIEYFDIKILEQMVSDNAKALDWIIQYKNLKKKNDLYINSAIAVYNAQ